MDGLHHTWGNEIFEAARIASFEAWDFLGWTIFLFLLVIKPWITIELFVFLFSCIEYCFRIKEKEITFTCTRFPTYPVVTQLEKYGIEVDSSKAPVLFITPTFDEANDHPPPLSGCDILEIVLFMGKICHRCNVIWHWKHILGLNYVEFYSPI